jgi:hypothetical protein
MWVVGRSRKRHAKRMAECHLNIDILERELFPPERPQYVQPGPGIINRPGMQFGGSMEFTPQEWGR